MISWLHYVRHIDVPVYEANGWRFASELGPTHGAYSILMIWMGGGEPSPSPRHSPTAERDAR